MEVANFLKMMSDAYAILGLEYEMALSTRPEGYLGTIDMWNKAEGALQRSLESTGKPWKLNPEDGAFYGPKIDITVFDALRRKFQCATVQLDFQLPIRFNLSVCAPSLPITKTPTRWTSLSISRSFAPISSPPRPT